jgi:hypothetical protein
MVPSYLAPPSLCTEREPEGEVYPEKAGAGFYARPAYSLLLVIGCYFPSSALDTLHKRHVRSGDPYIGSTWLLDVRTLGLDFIKPCSGPGSSG